MTDTLVRNDRPLALGVAFAFALSIGIAIVAVPLLAIDSGYDAAAVGYIVATSAASQLATRLALPWLLGRFADRTLIASAAVLMGGAFGLLLLSTALPAFLLAQLGQGAARAIFWTSSQTHAIRSGGQPVKRLVDLNLAGNAGTLTGPALAGLLATIGLPVAIAGAAVAVGVAAVGAPLMAAFPPYDRKGGVGAFGLLRRDGVDVACWANFVAGTWWSMIGSYIPVVLVGAGLGPAIIGWLVTLSEGAGAATLLVLRRTSTSRINAIVRAGAFVEMGVLAGIAVAPPILAAYAALLIVGGTAAGAVTSLAPALVTMVSGDQEHGDALALSGTFRSIAMLAAPASVGAALGLVALPVALVAVAALSVTPGVALARRRGGAASPPVAAWTRLGEGQPAKREG
ncbi:MAG TPA: MFS transporter [Candidatus Limnocylindria bacterium]|nr:MFS transporter [Candidatus Limnocylindria bacterium]